MEVIELLAERLINYCNDILDGNILACKKHQYAVKRFLNDLEKAEQEGDEFPYYFDMEEVEKFYEWSKLFKYSSGHKNGVPLKGKYIELEDFMLFVCANIFGWKHRETGYRRFSKSYIQLARKQAKSFLLSIIATYVAFLNGSKSEVYIAGWGLKQSQHIYKEINTQLKNCDFLRGKWSDSYHRITHLKSESTIMALSKEAKNFDGTNPDWIIIDEWHQHKTREILESLESGMVKPNAGVTIITTAGMSLSGPCYEDYQFVAKLLDENNTAVENDNFFALVCEVEPELGDDITDEKVWIKANPLQATFPEGMDTIRKKLKEALQIPSQMDSFKTKNMNIWVRGRKNGWLPMDKWEDAKDESIKLEDFRDMTCLVGFDLSAKRDLTSIGFVFFKDDNYYLFSHSFLPEDTLEEKMKSDKVNYRKWEEDGWLTVTPEAVVDYRFVKQYIMDTVKEYNLKVLEVCADTWNASQFIHSLEDEGLLVVEIAQTMKNIGQATKDFEEKLFQKRIFHNGSPVLTFAVGNAVTQKDHAGNYKISKNLSTERIDPIAAILNCFVRFETLEGGRDLNSHILSDDWSF